MGSAAENLSRAKFASSHWSFSFLLLILSSCIMQNVYLLIHIILTNLFPLSVWWWWEIVVVFIILFKFTRNRASRKMRRGQRAIRDPTAALHPTAPSNTRRRKLLLPNFRIIRMIVRITIIHKIAHKTKQFQIKFPNQIHMYLESLLDQTLHRTSHLKPSLFHSNR